MRTFLLLALSLFATGAWASSPLCKDVNSRQLPVGESCTTAAGVNFTLVARAAAAQAAEEWRDEKTGLIWGDLLVDGITLRGAERKCHRLGAGSLLPSRPQFEAAAADGGKEVLPNITGYSFWTATRVVDDSYSIYTYSLENSKVGGGDFRVPRPAVRCVRPTDSR